MKFIKPLTALAAFITTVSADFTLEPNDIVSPENDFRDIDMAGDPACSVCPFYMSECKELVNFLKEVRSLVHMQYHLPLRDLTQVPLWNMRVSLSRSRCYWDLLKDGSRYNFRKTVVDCDQALGNKTKEIFEDLALPGQSLMARWLHEMNIWVSLNQTVDGELGF
ncbi:uncharacterized protein EI97DRAFT_443183 [Westerdykella ornata]|uniref:Saposin B-type domain-containing protein n=1 Tax=Westerdykella ornata TaxID=318751 RepID=A0A6A6JFI7_WESOR|nr:uncharacterized protein EI97DRAFT_443183 [Westerdykella ornata]KAF2275311.1 hypothetical protein EI97DRAFT_443183 [Westerdykella ornata]